MGWGWEREGEILVLPEDTSGIRNLWEYISFTLRQLEQNKHSDKAGSRRDLNLIKLSEKGTRQR